MILPRDYGSARSAGLSKGFWIFTGNAAAREDPARPGFFIRTPVKVIQYPLNRQTAEAILPIIGGEQMQDYDTRETDGHTCRDTFVCRMDGTRAGGIPAPGTGAWACVIISGGG